MSARPFIDSLDFAGNGREISGVVPIARFARLQEELESPDGIVTYTLRGGVDRQDIPYLEVGAAGSCRLRCQRCLGALEYVVAIDTRLLLRDQASLDALDDHVTGADEEEFDSILAETELDVLSLLEEEILLSLPIAPKHEAGACRVADGESEFRVEKSPFAALAKLKVVN